ncbi:MAG: hypothetical protein QOJ94_1029 [Sphingomonadales bacterium]|jgi:uncharacterized protein (TIGR02246 family)|nr:hypothetical protein [Sphingomonadales bacterium]
MTKEFLARAALAAALCVGVAACDKSGTGGNAAAGNQAAGSTSAADDVKRVEQDMLAAWKAKDAARVASLYTDDAAVATPGAPLVRGHDAIAKSVGDDLKDPAFSLDFSNEDTKVAGSGELAYTRGTFRVSFTNPQTKKPQTMSGNYLTVFAKQGDGGWKAAEDFATEGQAPPSPSGT